MSTSLIGPSSPPPKNNRHPKGKGGRGWQLRPRGAQAVLGERMSGEIAEKVENLTH